MSYNTRISFTLIISHSAFSLSNVFKIVHTSLSFFFFFLNDTATPEIYPLPLHAALPISSAGPQRLENDIASLAPGRFLLGQLARLDQALHQRLVPGELHRLPVADQVGAAVADLRQEEVRSEEHTSELQSRLHLVCRLLLEKKKK